MDNDEEIKNLRKQNEWLRDVNSKLEIENKRLDELYMRHATGEAHEKREREKLQKEYNELLYKYRCMKIASPYEDTDKRITNLQSIADSLDSAFSKLKGKYDLLKMSHAATQAEKEALMGKNTELEEENTRLKEQVLYLQENNCHGCNNNN